MTLPYLNVACGGRYHGDWVNVDLSPSGPGVRACNVLAGLPFDDGSMQVVYHSHFLEHLPPDRGAAFLRECHRVLRPGGVVRVAVPDLADIARHYLRAMRQAGRGNEAAAHDYDWMMLELYDQAVRTSPGGRMRSFLEQPVLANEAFVFARSNSARVMRRKAASHTSSLTGQGGRSALGRVAGALRRLPSALRDGLLAVVLTPGEREALRVARFRLRGEVHQWMYDAYSLGRALGEAGFVEAQRRTADESDVPGWDVFALDTDGAGREYKPRSLYMEARKPLAGAMPVMRSAGLPRVAA